ncbi:hypothetical protein HP550_18280 [Cellulomonas humilata]|uniref:Uncharacterized protein n=1 Tax=Cellulomonas humilata TaxID=144055 RepID=A0A7Y6A5E5_9CELL|nr:hypothetical protein [Cellulomonas humilata]NUU19200.1 hypothetical protein [Cellulomonas humilata]
MSGLVAAGLVSAVPDEPWYVVVATLGPLVAAFGAIGALIVGILTVRQRTGADSRAQWWARVQWAVDLSFSPDESKRAVGFDALALLASSPLAGPDDDAFLAGLSLDVLDAAAERGAGDDADFVPADDLTPVRPSTARPMVPVSRSEVAAARLRVVTDRGRGRATPAWIARLAQTG